MLVDLAAQRSFHRPVKEKPGRKPLSEIKLRKDDAAPVEAQAEEIKTRYTQLFRI